MKYAYPEVPERVPPARKHGTKLGPKIAAGWFRDPAVKMSNCPFCRAKYTAYEAVQADLHKVYVGQSKHGLASKYVLVETVVRNTNNRVRPVFARTRKHACMNERCDHHISVDQRMDEDGKLLSMLKRSIYLNKGKKRSRKARRQAR
uniref:Uncharacterized protein n=1 Tax=viral metagenome TaxID=1070528 RepID=A0A2V0R970_9ZZZZ